MLILKNRFKKSNITIINVALSSNKHLMDYYEVDGDSAYNSLSDKHINTIVKGRNANVSRSIMAKKLETDTVDNYITTYGKPGYIKIDVEGHELEVIKGLKNLISLISFESNLPEFANETIEIIEYLSKISNDKYSFNACEEVPFIFDSFISKNQIIEFVKTTSFSSVEIYAKMK
jgi:FkbM family methyltransferase